MPFKSEEMVQVRKTNEVYLSEPKKKRDNTDRILVAAHEAEHAFSVLGVLLRHRVVGWDQVRKVACSGSAEVGNDCDEEDSVRVEEGPAF